MPGRRRGGLFDDSLCRRCEVQPLIILVRTEPLCHDCFGRYVQTKVVKRMESFRVRHSEPGQQRTLLLPLSFHACPLTLLHILHQHLKGQTEKTGRTGFKLLVLYVTGGALDEDVDQNAALASLKSRYPDHEYQSIALSDVVNMESMSSLLPCISDRHVHRSNDERISDVIKSINSSTSRQDLEGILRRRLVVSYAKRHDCEAILWPDSTTKLAERTLAETAKGRGFALPWTVTDGQSPHGVPFYYPLRDLLNKEIDAYASSMEPSLDAQFRKREIRLAVSTKNSTIDDLMAQYFETVERDYPSIVANVVRTSAKLVTPDLAQVEMQCELCVMPLEGQAPPKSRLCYACIRTLPQAAAE